MQTAIIEYGYAVVAGEIVVFNYDSQTRVYLSQTTEYLQEGVSIPANSCTDKPLENKKGYVVCRDSKLTGWEYLEDHRGETVWNVKTGAAQDINAPGDCPPDTTIYAPATPYDMWNGERWVTDKAAQQEAEIETAEATKVALIKDASEQIAPLQDAVELEMATDAEKASFNAWRKYRVLLTRVDTSTAPAITWPEAPAA